MPRPAHECVAQCPEVHVIVARTPHNQEIPLQMTGDMEGKRVHIVRMPASAIAPPSARTRPHHPLPPPLRRAAFFSGAVIVVAAIGLLIDPRVITGAPAWLKPAKFGLSVLIYVLSIAWMVRDLPSTRALRVAVSAIGILLIAEMFVVCLQAARGTTSHFNVDTPLDTAIFSGMGFGIATVWIASAVVLWQHLRSTPADRAMAWALRFGLALNILGAGIGWTMTRPFPGQIEAMQSGVRPRIVGAHTVGGPDGGAGMPITRWSTAHGDLRVAHFVGMHALQLLPLLLLGLRRFRGTRDDRVERSTLSIATVGYLALVMALLAQAMSGNPFVSLAAS